MSSSNPNNRSADDVELIGSDNGSNDNDNNNNNNGPNDYKHYDGVYYGSSDDDDDYDTDIDITDALLGDIGEPDENEEPYDILADNGEFLYSEEDQRPYVATTSLDLMSATQGATSPIMMPISEEEEEEEEDREEEEGERILEAAGEEEEEEKVAGTRSRKSDSTSKSREIAFHAGRGAKNRTLQPRPASPPTPMYQMPLDYSIRSKTHNSNKRDNSGESVSVSDSEGASESDSEDDRSSSSSMVSGSIKQLVLDIDGVLNDMRPEGSFDSDEQTDRVVNSSYTDDATITSDVSVGALTRLSGELDLAQENFMLEFTGIDATGFRGPRQKKKRQKKKKKKFWLRQQQPSMSPTSPSGEDTDDNNSGYRRARGDTKISTIVKLSASYAIIIGVLVVIYIMTRNDTNTETSINSSISNDPIPSVLTTLPTLSPVTDDAFAGDSISLSPEVVTTAPSSSSNIINANANADTIMPTEPKSTLTPSLRPSKRSQKTVSPTAAPTRKAKSFAPTTTPTLPKTIPPTAAPTRKAKSFAPIPTPTLFTNVPTLPISDKLNGTHDENEIERTQSPALSSSAKANDDKEETEDKDGGQYSFEMPDSSDSRQWDDDDFQPNEFMGEDDFYSNDNAYEYEKHHPDGDEYEKDSKYSKQGKHHGNPKVEKAHATKKDKALKGPKQPKQRQWQEINPPRPSPTIIRESVTRIRKRRNVPRGH